MVESQYFLAQRSTTGWLPIRASQTASDRLNVYAKELGFDAAVIKEKELGKVGKKALNPAIDALDIALFGRMTLFSSV